MYNTERVPLRVRFFFCHEPRKKWIENGFYDNNSIELVTLIFVQPFLGPIVITLDI